MATRINFFIATIPTSKDSVLMKRSCAAALSELWILWISRPRSHVPEIHKCYRFKQFWLVLILNSVYYINSFSSHVVNSRISQTDLSCLRPVSRLRSSSPTVIAELLGWDGTDTGPETNNCDGRSYTMLPLSLWLWNSTEFTLVARLQIPNSRNMIDLNKLIERKGNAPFWARLPSDLQYK